MIGPWKAVINKLEYQFRAVTCIDAVIDLPEVIPVEDDKSKIVANTFEDTWLSRYSSPRQCIHDNGNEFVGPEFWQILKQGIIYQQYQPQPKILRPMQWLKDSIKP